jgi:tRNA uridine 5-carboxymethylaminomethyl modification enzyme
MFHMKHYDVVVIGGGHAGTEAAAAAARMGATTALLTMRPDRIGAMSCNPALGGVGKGHLIREIDALDGIMGRAGDKSAIQYRLLNRSKGPAVQGPRVQADRSFYLAAVQKALGEIQALEIIKAEVVDLKLRGAAVSSIILGDGQALTARAVILTAGTFLNGVMHIGSDQNSGGRMGDAASRRLADVLSELMPGRGRLKTGTPPRLDGNTIRWDVLDKQEGDNSPVMLSFVHKAPFNRQISCGITHTNERTHEIVRENLASSAMYGGHIEGVGPRYCPSIEDKIVRFADKPSHQVFLEPEGLADTTVYPNGISTSLPASVQEAYVRSIAGLENVRITQPGYAIEYDFFDPCALTRGLQTREVKGLYFAGQINGTTGYEEAAAQGLIAGINAARFARGEDDFVLERSQGYIGVMLDDLVTRGVTEPYRMFTSRAEFRLSLRADNADQRLTPIGMALGCVTDERVQAFEKKMEFLQSGRRLISQTRFSPNELAAAGVVTNKDGIRRTALDILAFPDVTLSQIQTLVPETASLDAEILEQLRRESLYAAYEGRQQQHAEALGKSEHLVFPSTFDFRGIPGLSNELQQKLDRVRPETLSQASRIEGMTPAAMALLHLRLKASAADTVQSKSA